VKPAELRIVHDQTKKLADVYDPVLAFVVSPFHFKQRFVQAKERAPKRNHLFAGAGIIAFAMQRIWRT